MIIKASAALRNDYAAISDLAKKTQEPIYITRNGEGDGVYMNIEAFEKREKMLELRAKLLVVEAARLNGEQGVSIDELDGCLSDLIDEVKHGKKAV